MPCILISRAAISGFESLALRASGQVAVEVKSHKEVLELTLQAWQSLQRSVFSAAWISCGYVDDAHMDLHAPGSARRVIEEAQTSLSDLFSPYGKCWSPQRCMCYEWQIQDSVPKKLFNSLLTYPCAILLLRSTEYCDTSSLATLINQALVLYILKPAELQLECNCQDDSSEWAALPYEIASAFVRTLAIHMHQLQEAREAYNQLLANDASETAASTIKAKGVYENLKNYSRFVVMNARTGHLATQDWVARNVTRLPDGTPTWKNKSAKKSSPWAMIFTFKTQGKEAELFLNLAVAAPQRRVRCWDLRGGNERCKIASMLVGYEHLLNDFEPDDEAQASDAESEATAIGDEAGLPGLVLVQCFLVPG